MNDNKKYKVFSDAEKEELVLTKRAKTWLFHLFIRLLMFLFHVILSVVNLVGLRRRKVPDKHYEILLTGTFHSDNWVTSHLRPLAKSKYCKRLRVVSIYPVPEIENVELIRPPNLLIKLIGGVPARMLTFLWVGIYSRPDIVGGFHLLFNGLIAVLLAKFIGAHSMYFCVGGPAEILGGGVASENRLFEKLKTADRVVESQLLRVISYFDLVITMGSSAAEFFRAKGVDSSFHIVSGGLDDQRYAPNGEEKTIDLIIVGRMSLIKRMDVFLRAVSYISNDIPNVKAVIVGDGALKSELKNLASRLGIQRNVEFTGQQNNIDEWLKKSKIFVLTSDSEGLSLALMEAMLCGLPAVVSDVGDLSDIVNDGVNGYLVKERKPEDFASRILNILANQSDIAKLSKQARESGQRYGIANCVKLWDEIFAKLE